VLARARRRDVHQKLAFKTSVGARSDLLQPTFVAGVAMSSWWRASRCVLNALAHTRTAAQLLRGYVAAQRPQRKPGCAWMPAALQNIRFRYELE